MKQVALSTTLFLFISLLIQHGSIGAMTPSQGQMIQSNASQPAITCSMYAIEHHQGQNILIRPAAIEPSPLKKTSYSCELCPKIFLWEKDLIIHNRTHTREKPFTCDLCPKKFAQKGSLTVHKNKIHIGKKPHSCKECSENFFEKKDLIVHTMIHTGVKPFTCEECNESFKQNTHLTIHKRIHSKEKPYLCDMCPKSFSQSSNLATHRRTHTKEKPFTCTLCNKGYDDQSNYNRHMKSKTHKEKHLENEDPEIIDWAENIHNENIFTTTDDEPFSDPFPAIAFFQLDL